MLRAKNKILERHFLEGLQPQFNIVLQERD